jgi:hypothetical protein
VEQSSLSVKEVDTPSRENEMLVKLVRNHYGAANVKLGFYDDLDRLFKAYFAMKYRGMDRMKAIKKFLVTDVENEYTD